MIRLISTAVAVGLVASTAAQAAGPDIAALVKTRPAWSEEFNNGPTSGEWDRGLSPWPETIANRILPQTAEEQVYVDSDYLGTETAWPMGGTMGMMARRMDKATRNRIEQKIAEERPLPAYVAALRKATWVSAVLKGRKSFKYGYIEASIRWDGSPESWPAFWLLPAEWGWPPEIDIVEMKIENGVPMAVMGIHSRQIGWKNKGCRVPIPNGGVGFHRYGFYWNARSAIFYLDGKISCQMPVPYDLHQSFYPIMNLAIGGWGKSPTAASRDPQLIQIDYIRRWAG
jgi:hypothetical protein